MSLRPQPLPPVPDDTVRVAQAAFRRCNPYMLMRDRLGTVFADADFADLYPKLGQRAYAPWRLALVTLMQFCEAIARRPKPCEAELTGNTCSLLVWPMPASIFLCCASSVPGCSSMRPPSAS